MSIAEEWIESAKARDKFVAKFLEALGIVVLVRWLSDRMVDFHYWLLAASRLSGAREEFLREKGRSRVTIKVINVLEVLYGFYIGCQRPDCDARRGVRVMGAATAYAKDSRRANAPSLLCQDCREEYSDYWREMWQEYYSNLL